MSYFPPTIRYEYADESNTSQPSSVYADPPLFKEEVPDESHYFFHSNSTNQSQPFPSSAIVQVHDEENLHPSVASFSPFGIGETSHDFHHSHNQPTPSSVDYFFWQSDEASSSSACVEERRPMYSQYDHQKQMGRNEREKSAEQCQRNGEQQQQTWIVPCTLSVSVQRNSDGTIPTMDEQPSMRRMPLQSMENAAIQRAEKNPADFSPVDVFSGKVEHVESIPPKARFGPPAHWRVEGTDKRQRRSAKRATFPKPTTYQIDEHGRQVVLVGGDDSFRSNDEDEERTENEREGPPVACNGFVKPAYSYSCLIGLSLKNSETGELTVSEIYTFLCYHFPYFREAPSGWKNSVRHNLSLNKCFQKIEVETPGGHGRKSCLWRMNPQKCAKMDQELRKWRDREEERILDAMEMPQNLDALQDGTMGMPPNMKPRRFSIAPSAVDGFDHRIELHSSSSSSHSQQQHQIVTHRSAVPSKRTSPPLQRSFGGPSSLVTFDHQLPPLPPMAQRQNAIAQSQRNVQNDALVMSNERQRHSVHAQAARKLDNLLQQKQISSDPMADEAAGYFGGFTLIGGGPSGSGGKKRRSSDNEFSS